MSNRVVRDLALLRLKQFAQSFVESKTLFWDDNNKELIHAGEFGAYRESLSKDLFKLILPNRFDVGNGFLVNNVGDISSQCDVVIFDKTATPNIESDQRQKFYPAETVVAIGEIKSIISGPTELSNHLGKLAKIKSIREKTDEPYVHYRDYEGKYDPLNNPYDQFFSFLICSKLNYVDKQPDKLLYSNETQQRHKHNFILSIEDGAYIYKSPNGQNIYIPNIGNTDYDNFFISSNKSNRYIHFEHFLSALIMSINMTTVLRPDMALYITDNIVRKVT